jgi:hypothetical protein
MTTISFSSSNSIYILSICNHYSFFCVRSVCSNFISSIINIIDWRHTILQSSKRISRLFSIQDTFSAIRINKSDWWIIECIVIRTMATHFLRHWVYSTPPCDIRHIHPGPEIAPAGFLLQLLAVVPVIIGKVSNLQVISFMLHPKRVKIVLPLFLFFMESANLLHRFPQELLCCFFTKRIL